MYLKIPEAAKLLDVSYNTIKKWTKEGDIQMRGSGTKGDGREVPFHALLIYLFRERKLWYLREEKGARREN